MILCSLSFAQEAADSISTEKVTAVSKLRVKAGIGMSRKFGEWTSEEFSTYNYLLKDLRLSGVKTLGVDYLIKDKGDKRVYIGVLYSGVSGKKTLPNQSFSDSLGNAFVSDYSFSASYSTIAIQIAGTRYLGEGETLALWSALQLGNTWFESEEFAVNTKASTGTTKAFGAMLGLDVRLTKNIYLGGEIRAWYSKIGQLEVARTNEATKEILVEEIKLEDLQQINLSRIDFTIGARYYF